MLGALVLVLTTLWVYSEEINSDRLNLDEKLLLACFQGQRDVARKVVREGANIEAVLSPEIGEVTLRLGIAGIDFPVAPALHVAINGGAKGHLQVASHLLSVGADPKRYDRNYEGSGFAFGPAFTFGLGLGNEAMEMQNRGSTAELLRLLWKTHESQFDLDSLQPWVNEELGNAFSALHVSAHIGSVNSTYVLLADFGMRGQIDRLDFEGHTPLMRAAAAGHWEVMKLLIYNGADPNKEDEDGRRALHLAAMHGCHMCFASILYGKSHEQIADALEHEDVYGMTALDFASLPPERLPATSILKRFTGHEEAAAAAPRPSRRMPFGEIPHEVPSEDATMTRLYAAERFSDSVGWFFHTPQRDEILSFHYIYDLVKIRPMDTVPAEEATPQHMDQKYWRTGRPAVVTGNVTASSATGLWSRLEWNTFFGAVAHVRAWGGPMPPPRSSRASGSLVSRGSGDPLQEVLAKWQHVQRANAKEREEQMLQGDASAAQKKTKEQQEVELAAYFMPEASVMSLLLPPNVFRFGHGGASAREGLARDVHARLSLGGGASHAGLLAAHTFLSTLCPMGAGARRTDAAVHFVVVGAVEAFVMPQLYIHNITMFMQDSFPPPRPVSGSETGRQTVEGAEVKDVPFETWRRVVAPRKIADGTWSHVYVTAGDILFVPRGWVAFLVPMTDTLSLHETVSELLPF